MSHPGLDCGVLWDPGIELRMESLVFRLTTARCDQCKAQSGREASSEEGGPGRAGGSAPSTVQQVLPVDQAREDAPRRRNGLGQGAEAGTNVACRGTGAAQYERWALLSGRTPVPCSH